jgi:hypothetical protein
MNTPILEGMPGEPLPYLLHSDWMITTILFFCILLCSLAVSKEKKYLYQRFKSFLINRERASMFDEITASDFRYNLLLILHTCILLGICIYHYYASHHPELLTRIPHSWLVGIFTLSTCIFLTIKSILYQSINWIFFQKERNSVWITSFFNLIIWLGILLLPIVLVIVYFDIPPQSSLYAIAFLIVFAKISLFWKCFCNFFEKIHGAFHLILYFCALEILPDLILWKGIELVSNNLILKL